MKIYAIINGQRQLVEHTEITKAIKFSGEIQGLVGSDLGDTCCVAWEISEEVKKEVWFKHNQVLVRVKHGSKVKSTT